MRRVFLAFRWKINFGTEFKYENECSLLWRGEYELLISPLDTNSFWVFKKEEYQSWRHK